MQPDAALQTAIRSKLVTALAGLVEPAAIRVGTIRPETFPAVVLSMPSVEINGRASGGQTPTSRARIGAGTGDDDDGDDPLKV